MEILLTCPTCRAQYDDADHVPKLLPCTATQCLACAKAQRHSVLANGEYRITCSLCTRMHVCASSPSDLPTSKIASHFVAADASPEVLPAELAAFKDKFDYDINLAKFELHKHYDNMELDVDIRADTLINFIHSSREVLLQRIKAFRAKAVEDFETPKPGTVLPTSVFRPNPPETLKSLRGELNLLYAAPVTINTASLSSIRAHCDKIQAMLDDYKKRLWYFSQQTEPDCASLLGYMLNGKIDRNYLRVKNLKTILADEGQCQRIQLNSEFNQTTGVILRRHLVPLSRDRIIKIFFSSHMSALHLELFDATGAVIKSVEAFQGIKSFPVYSGFGNCFAVAFSSQSNVHRENMYHIQLYDSNLNLVQSMTHPRTIESLYLNDRELFVTFGYKPQQCCLIYNHKLQQIGSFGQQEDANGAFYLEKSVLSNAEKKRYNIKVNPQLFGYTTDSIYTYNRNKMCIISRSTGFLTKTIALSADIPYYLIDAQENIIEVKTTSKTITLFSAATDYSVQNTYSAEFEHVVVTKDNDLVFADKELEFVVFV